MYRALENAYIKTVGDTDIIAIWNKEWEVYYKRPEYPMLFAFGLPGRHHTSEVFEVAEANMENYEHLFE